ncbi:flagellar filament capping protein FliD [Alkalilimnicola ehrlichii]|nr:flagellar filament capping protein FliD [Alkalilimnicola ehrlichii]
MTITAMGMGSGLDIAGIVNQLVAAERAPRQARIDQRESRAQAELSALGTLKSGLSKFQGTLEGFKDGSAFNSRLASSSHEDAVGVTAGSKAQAGQYSVRVDQLAQAHKVRTGDFDSASEVVNTDAGVITLTVGGEAVDIDIAAGSKLSDIRDAINQADAGVNATIVNVDGDDGTPVARLVLTATETGTANEISIQAGGELDRFDSANLYTLEEAQNAIIQVDGQQVTRSSNDIDDVIDGVTLSLQPGSEGVLASVRIDLDQEGVTEAVNSFIEAYNALHRQMRQLSHFNVDTGQRAALAGDSTIRSISSTLSMQLSQPLNDDPDSPFTGLMSIGIEYQRDGTLRLNETKFNEALAQDFDAVSDMFGGDDGLAARLDDALDQYSGRDGLLGTREDGVQSTLRRVEDDRMALDRYMERYEGRVRRQFTNLDMMVAQMQSTSDFLTGQLANLPFNNIGKR